MKKRIASIEFFRFSFACCVAIWHLGAIDKIKHGYLPVEFFFILSGIWLYSAYEKGKATGQTAARYTWRRIQRIYPAYLIAFLATFLFRFRTITSVDGWFKIIPELLLLQRVGPFENGLNYPLWYLSALLAGGYLVYAMLERWEATSLKLLFPLISLGTYTYIFSLGGSIEVWKTVGPFYIPLVRAMAGLCLGVCLRRLTTWLQEQENRLLRLAIDFFSICSVGGVVFAIFCKEYLDRYCILFFCSILIACLTEGSWLNIVLRGSIWRWLGKYSLEMFMIHAAVAEAWKSIPWKPSGPLEKSVYVAAYLVLTFVSAVILNKLSESIRGTGGKKGGKQYGKWVLPAAMVVCCVWFACHQRIWTDVDNYYVAMITNGVFSGSDNYAQHLHPILCRMIAALHHILPQADCFSLLMRVLLIAGAGWMGYLLSRQTERFGLACGGCVAILVVILTSELFGANYTIMAAALAFVGLFSIFTALSTREGKKKSLVVLGTVFLAFGFMLRKESGLLALPFFALTVFTEFLSAPERKKRCVELLKTVAVPVLVVGLLLLTNTLFWMSPDRVQDAQYHESRIALVDYPVKSWEEIRDQLPEVSENDYQCIRSWIFADTELMDSDFMRALAHQASDHPHLTASAFMQTIRTVFHTVCSRNVRVFSLLVVALFFALLFLPQTKYERLETILALVGGCLIMFYLAFMGRFPERVCIAVCLPILAVLIKNLLKAVRRPFSFSVPLTAVLAFTFLLACLCVPGQLTLQDNLTLASTANAPADESQYEQTYRNDAIYLCSSHMCFWAFSGQNRLPPPPEYLKHYVSLGDWAYGQTYHREYLSSVGVPNPMLALLTRENTYLLRDDCTLVLRYLQEHYAPDVVATQEGIVGGVKVWKFSSKSLDVSESKKAG